MAASKGTALEPGYYLFDLSGNLITNGVIPGASLMRVDMSNVYHAFDQDVLIGLISHPQRLSKWLPYAAKHVTANLTMRFAGVTHVHTTLTIEDRKLNEHIPNLFVKHSTLSNGFQDDKYGESNKREVSGDVLVPGDRDDDTKFLGAPKEKILARLLEMMDAGTTVDPKVKKTIPHSALSQLLLAAGIMPKLDSVEGAKLFQNRREPAWGYAISGSCVSYLVYFIEIVAEELLRETDFLLALWKAKNDGNLEELIQREKFTDDEWAALLELQLGEIEAQLKDNLFTENEQTDLNNTKENFLSECEKRRDEIYNKSAEHIRRVEACSSSAELGEYFCSGDGPYKRAYTWMTVPNHQQAQPEIVDLFATGVDAMPPIFIQQETMDAATKSQNLIQKFFSGLMCNPEKFNYGLFALSLISNYFGLIPEEMGEYLPMALMVANGFASALVLIKDASIKNSVIQFMPMLIWHYFNDANMALEGECSGSMLTP